MSILLHPKAIKNKKAQTEPQKLFLTKNYTAKNS